MTRHPPPPVFTQYMFFFTFITCFFFFHSRLSILLSLQYYTVSVLLSINPHFLFSFYPCSPPKHACLFQNRFPPLHSYNMRLKFSFLSIHENVNNVILFLASFIPVCFVGDVFFFPFFFFLSDHSPLFNFLTVIGVVGRDRFSLSSSLERFIIPVRHR